MTASCGLARVPREMRESDNSIKKRAEPGSRTKDCRQRIGSYLYSGPTSATADKTAGQTFDKIVVGVER